MATCRFVCCGGGNTDSRGISGIRPWHCSKAIRLLLHATGSGRNIAQTLAKLTSTDYLLLKSIVDRSLGFKVIGVEGVKKIVEQLSRRATPHLLTTAAFKEGSRFIPLIGSFIAAPVSFGGTYYALKLVLDKMESVALEVVTAAAESATAVEDSDDD